MSGVLKIPLFNFRFISKEAVDYGAHQSTHTPNGKTFGECAEVAQKDYQVSKSYYPKQRDCRCRRVFRVRAGTAGGLLQGVGKLCVGNDRRSYCAAFRRGSSEELVSLAGAVGQEAPWQQQGQGAAITWEALGWTETPAPAESVLSKPQSSPTVLLILLTPFLPRACFLSPQRHRVALRRGRHEKSEGQALARCGWEGRGLQGN